MSQPLLIVCADVGSVAADRFGWWSIDHASGTELSTLANYVASALDSGHPVALGFECPLFVPLAEEESLLTRARPGEGSRPWSAGAGCGVLTTGLVQVAWVLSEVRKALQSPCHAYLDWHAFSTAGSGLFLWEAFVSGASKASSHVEDAERGALAFAQALPDPCRFNAVQLSGAVYSLVGAALLRTGWVDAPSLLAEPCVVIKGVPNT